jgi:Coenzyme PQQ synthesis protein D (PqqD)
VLKLRGLTFVLKAVSVWHLNLASRPRGDAERSSTTEAGAEAIANSATTSSPLLAAVRVPSHVVRRDFAAETVLLNVNTGKYHGLSPTAGRMLAVLEEAGNVAAAAGRISLELERPLAEIERELSAFCRSLADRDLIEIDYAGST